MTLDDFDEFCEVVVGFAELKGKQLSPAALKLYFRAVQSWDLQEFKAAAEHLLCTSEFMPTPKNFTDLRNAGKPTAHEAWETAFANCTSWRTGDSKAGELIDRVVRSIGGYRAIAMADQERDLPHIQRRFLEAYEDLSKVEPARQAVPQIAAVGARIALRGPAPVASFLPKLERAKTNKTRVSSPGKSRDFEATP